MKKFLLTCFTLAVVLLAQAQERTVTGKVTSAEDGTPLPGVSVLLKGTTTGTATDAEGNFSLSVPSTGGSLVFSFIGLETREIEIGERTVINVALGLDITQLSEVVVVGYGTQERKELTGSVASVSSKAIENLVTPSFDAQLAGRAPGVQITTPGGILGQAPIIRIRGVNSLTSSASPLIVIDGVPVVNSDRSGIVPANPLANINPSDIESFDILKDGSATAIYGSRAANGVILITTKRGAKGRPKVDYSASFGFNQEVDRFDLLTGDQFVEIANEKRSNAGSSQLAQPGVNTDWQDYIFRKGSVQQHNLSLSGGTDQTTYFFSLGYTSQESPIIANDLERYSFRANLDQQVGKKLKIGTSMSYSHTTINGLNNGSNSLSGAMYNASRMLPNVPILDPANVAFDGFNVEPDGSTLGRGNNLATVDNNIPNIAFVLANNVYRNKTHRIIGNVYGELELLEGLSFRTQVGTDLTLSEDFLSWDPRHGDGRGRGGYAQNGYNPASRWNWHSTLNYQTVLADDHNLNVTLGVEYQKSLFNNFAAVGQGFADRFFQQDNLISNSYSVQTTSGGYAERGFDSYFARANYNFRGKYLLSLTIRNDGISDLAEENRRGTFPGASIGWRVSDEDFFNVSFISDLKIRASYAEVGNVEIGTFAYAGGYGAILYGGTPGIGFAKVTNPNLSWESSKKLNIGFNATVGPVTVEADYFVNNIDDMVLDAPTAPSLGFPDNNISQNIGSMINKGLELRLMAKVYESGEFSWSTDFNFTYQTNEVTKLLSPISGGTTNRTEEGRSIGELYGVRWAGVNPANGNPLYYKADGSIVQYNLVTSASQRTWKVYDPANPADVGTNAPALGADDYAFLGNTLPKWMGGWTNNLSYGDFSLEIFFRYSGGNYVLNETRRGQLGQGFSNNHASILNRWTEAGQVTDVPKLFSGQDANMWQTGTANSRFVEKGDFLKVQNIVLAYRVPAQELQNVLNGSIKSLRIFAQVQNPITITGYSGLDPELNVSSSQLQFGVDNLSAPIIRTWSVGLNVGL